MKIKRHLGYKSSVSFTNRGKSSVSFTKIASCLQRLILGLQNGISFYNSPISSSLPKGKPERILDYISEEYHSIVLADAAYRRGDTSVAKELWMSIPEDSKLKLSAASLAIITAITSGDMKLYDEIETYLKRIMAEYNDKRIKALYSIPLVNCIVSMMANTLTPEWVKNCDFSMFPVDIAPFLVYLHAIYLRNIEDYDGMLTAARTALALTESKDMFTWLDINFRLLCAMGCFKRNELILTEKYLSEALDLAIPYGYYITIAEYFCSYGDLLEKCIEKKCPNDRKKIVQLWEMSTRNWSAFHNKFTNDNLTTQLTAQEYKVARVVASGATYKEAAKYMNLSVSRIQDLLSSTYSKLLITKKSELKKYIL